MSGAINLQPNSGSPWTGDHLSKWRLRLIRWLARGHTVLLNIEISRGGVISADHGKTIHFEAMHANLAADSVGLSIGECSLPEALFSISGRDEVSLSQCSFSIAPSPQSSALVSGGE